MSRRPRTLDREAEQPAPRPIGWPQRPESAPFSSNLIAIIDRAAKEQPTLTTFIDRLKGQGVDVLPSGQSSGKWNGVSYRYQGETVKGSDLGRSYSAQGLIKNKQVRYDPERDTPALREALERAGPRPREPVDRTARERDPRTGFNPDQLAILKTVGTFRSVNVRDLGPEATRRTDLQDLIRRGFAEQRTILHAGSGREYKVAVLTKHGRDYMRKIERKKPEGERQRYYAGLVKPAEIRHDIAIFRMYHLEKERIEQAGGSIRRVTLDHELKGRMWSELNKRGPLAARDPRQKADVADRNGLAVVNGKVVFPDLRIEYLDRDLAASKLDLELATGDYKASQMAAKHAAGLRIYGPESGPGAPHHDQEMIAGLISL